MLHFNHLTLALGSYFCLIGATLYAEECCTPNAECYAKESIPTASCDDACEPATCQPESCPPDPCEDKCLREPEPEPCPSEPCMIEQPAFQSCTMPCWGGFAFVTPIYFQARENGLGFALKGTTTTFITGGGTNRTVNPDFDWDFGFRAGAGVRLPHDGWRLGVTWQRLYTSSHHSVNVPLDQALFPVYLHPASFMGNDAPIALSSKAEWKLRYNQIDLQMDRPFAISSWLVLRPHAGLRSAWVYQSYDVTYSNLLDDIPAAFSRKVDMHCNFWGIGILGGLDAKWNLGCGWSIATDFETSVLYGYFKIKQIQTRYTTDDFGTLVYSAPDFYHTTRTISDMLIGLQYEYGCIDDWMLSLKLGWDLQMLYDQNQFQRFVDETTPGVYAANQGDLTIQGVSLMVRLDF